MYTLSMFSTGAPSAAATPQEMKGTKDQVAAHAIGGDDHVAVPGGVLQQYLDVLSSKALPSRQLGSRSCRLDAPVNLGHPPEVGCTAGRHETYLRLYFQLAQQPRRHPGQL